MDLFGKFETSLMPEAKRMELKIVLPSEVYFWRTEHDAEATPRYLGISFSEDLSSPSELIVLSSTARHGCICAECRKVHDRHIKDLIDRYVRDANPETGSTMYVEFFMHEVHLNFKSMDNLDVILRGYPVDL
jgi:hypothetical protein